MEQPVPIMPTNVQSNNPYAGLDRGLFLIHYPGGSKYARIHAANWSVNGPEAAMGLLRYQVMQYETKPQVEAQYAAGTLLTAPDGGTWFDCLTRGQSYMPISVEYWGRSSIQKWYMSVEGATLLSQDEITSARNQGDVFVDTMGRFAGLSKISLEASFNCVGGNPLTRTSLSLSITHSKNGVVTTEDVPDLPTPPFDAVRVALSALRNL